MAQSYADITIVGAGIVGLSVAISIAERMPSLSVKVVDRGSGSSGASTRNAGFACIGSISEICSDIDTMGMTEALAVVKQRYAGLQELLRRVPSSAMDYKPCGGYEIFSDLPQYSAYAARLAEINDALATFIGIRECFESKEHPVFGATIYNRVEGSLHPAKMLSYLQDTAMQLGVSLVWDTTVTKVDSEHQLLHTSDGQMPTRTVVVCTNAWASRLLPNIKVEPARNQVLVTEPIEDLPIRGTYHMHEGYVYFRNIGDRLLIGGGRHLRMEQECTYDERPTDDYLLDYLYQLLGSKILKGKSIEISQSWTGHLGVGLQKSPIVSQIEHGLWVAARMGGMGVAIGSQIGIDMAQMLLDDWQHQPSQIVKR